MEKEKNFREKIKKDMMLLLYVTGKSRLGFLNFSFSNDVYE